jgi:hypothetical protein
MRRTRIIKCAVLKKNKTPYAASEKTNAPYHLDQQNTTTAVNAEIKEKKHIKQTNTHKNRKYANYTMNANKKTKG